MSYIFQMKMSSGFTLLELVIAMMLLASISLFSIQHGYFMLQRFSLEQTVVQLRNFLIYYQQEAVWLNANYAVQLQQQQAVWSLEILAGASEFTEVTRVPIARFTKPLNLVTMQLNSAGRGLFLNGQRGTNTAGHIIVANSAGKYKLIISSLGRIRLQRCANLQDQIC